MKRLTKENMIDILYGCAVLGTGGGGHLQDGIALIQEDIAQDKPLYMISVEELDEEKLVATPYGCGAPPAPGVPLDPKYARLPMMEGSCTIRSLRGLENFMGEKFQAVSSTELGGENTAEALHIACELGIPIVDADPVGRSVPELQHSTYFIKGKPITPMGISTQFGEVIIIQSVVDDYRAEELVRGIAVASNNLVGVTDHPMTGKEYGQSVIPNALTYAMKIGETLRKCQAMDENVPEAIVTGFSGKLLFQGVITAMPWECKGGFNVGDIFIDGNGGFSGETYKIWFKNEFIISYRNDTVDMTTPDLICMFDEKGNPITNPNAEIGAEVTIIGLPSDEIWKTPEGLDCFGPRSFGFDVDYKPFTLI